MDADKKVMVSFNDLNKVISIHSGTGKRDINVLKEQCIRMFKFGSNIKLDMTFQRYDSDWAAFVDLQDSDDLNNKDKLKLVIQPMLTDNEVCCKCIILRPLQ